MKCEYVYTYLKITQLFITIMVMVICSDLSMLYTVCVPMIIDNLWYLIGILYQYTAQKYFFSFQFTYFWRWRSNIERYTRIKQSQRSRRRKLIFTYYICHTVWFLEQRKISKCRSVCNRYLLCSEWNNRKNIIIPFPQNYLRPDDRYLIGSYIYFEFWIQLQFIFTYSPTVVKVASCSRVKV